MDRTFVSASSTQNVKFYSLTDLCSCKTQRGR